MLHLSPCTIPIKVLSGRLGCLSRRVQAPACCNCERLASYLVGVCLWLRLESDTQIKGLWGGGWLLNLSCIDPSKPGAHIFDLEGWWERGKLHMQLSRDVCWQFTGSVCSASQVRSVMQGKYVPVAVL